MTISVLLKKATHHRFFFYCMTVLYLLIELVIYLHMPTANHITPDSTGYIIPAKEFAAQHSMALGLRLPGYPLFLSIPLHFGLALVPAIVFIQALLSILSAFFVHKITEQFVSDDFGAVFTIFLFNPYGLMSAQLIIPEVLYTAVLLLNLFFLLKGCASNSIASIALSGIFASAATLIRANGIVLFISGAFLILFFTAKKHRPFLHVKNLAFVGWFALASALALSPWLGYRYGKTGTINLVPSQYGHFARYEALHYLDMLISDSPYDVSARHVDKIICRVAAGVNTNCEVALREELYETASTHFFKLLADYGPYKIAHGLLKSLFLYFFSTGSTVMTTGMDLSSTSSHITNILLFGYVLLMRTFVMIGIYYAIVKRDYRICAFAFAYLLLYTIPIGFFGMARYRYPVDFAFFIIGFYGLKCVAPGISTRLGRV